MSNRAFCFREVLAVLSMFVVAAAAAGCGGGNGGSGTGGAVGSTGGTTGTGGASGANEVVDRWPEWPMPNSQVDVAAGAPNLQSYSDNGDGTVTDNVTGLMWQQAVQLRDQAHPGTGYTRADAVAYCATLTLAGYSDWRLPSRIELVSIVDTGQGPPSIDRTYFPSTPADWFWSSSSVPVAGGAWQVDFIWGQTTCWYDNEWCQARCVRFAAADPGASAERYVMVSGTVYDTKTKLTWQQTAPSTTYTWADAKTYCAGVGAILGDTGWRLPTMKELETIVDDLRTNPAPSTDPKLFPATPASDFWSSSPLAADSSSAWFVPFLSAGLSGWHDVSATLNVRCVR